MTVAKRLCCLSIASLAALALIAVSTSSSGASTPPGETISYVGGSTEKVCQLTGETDNETGKPTSSRTESRFGLVSGDRGYSFDYRGRVWWIFGDTGATPTFHGKENAGTRFPDYPYGIDNDSLASSVPTRPGKCPVLDFVTEKGGAYANPSATLHGVPIDLRTNETPVFGLEVGGQMYVTIATDNPQDVGRKSNCQPRAGKTTCFGHDTRVVMAVLAAPGTARFRGLYNLSAPKKPYGNGAKLEQNAMQRVGAYVYIWGPQGGNESRKSAPYLARLKASNIATGKGLEYFDGYRRGIPVFRPGESGAQQLYHDKPDCTGELGVEWDRYLNRWLLLYNCTDNTTANPRGIWLRTAPAPWGPWSKPQTIFSPSRDHGYCYFIHFQGKCPKGAPNPPGKGNTGGNYGPYFVQGWTTGTRGTPARPATSTIYYTIDTFIPYGQVIARSTLALAATKR